MTRCAGIDNVELPFIGREAQAVGPVEIVGHHCGQASIWIQPVDIARQLERFPILRPCLENEVALESGPNWAA